jgi:hypothetical protein
LGESVIVDVSFFSAEVDFYGTLEIMPVWRVCLASRGAGIFSESGRAASAPSG